MKRWRIQLDDNQGPATKLGAWLYFKLNLQLEPIL
jgi:hypothetical protein